MARALVVYATREGQTEKIARRIAGVLQSAGHTVELVDADQRSQAVDPARVDIVFVGSPIRAGGYLPSVVRFVRRHRHLLELVPSAFFSVGLAIVSRTHNGRAQTQKVVQQFLKQTGWRPRRAELIAGALPYSKYGFLMRFLMRRIAAREGGDTDTSRDYEYTDWEAVDRFASGFTADALRLQPSQAVPTPRAAMSAAKWSFR